MDTMHNMQNLIFDIKEKISEQTYLEIMDLFKVMFDEELYDMDNYKNMLQEDIDSQMDKIEELKYWTDGLRKDFDDQHVKNENQLNAMERINKKIINLKNYEEELQKRIDYLDSEIEYLESKRKRRRHY